MIGVVCRTTNDSDFFDNFDYIARFYFIAKCRQKHKFSAEKRKITGFSHQKILFFYAKSRIKG